MQERSVCGEVGLGQEQYQAFDGLGSSCEIEPQAASDLR